MVFTLSQGDDEGSLLSLDAFRCRHFLESQSGSKVPVRPEKL